MHCSFKYNLLMILAVVIGGQGFAEAQQGRFEQKEFVIGAFWIIHPDGESLDRRFAEIAEGHFTLVFGPIPGSSPAEFVALAAKHDLAAIVMSRGVVPEKLPRQEACWGYRVFDEPSATMFPTLKVRSDEILKVHPGKLDYINLFPNYASEKQLGVGELMPRRASPALYEQYVKSYVEQLDPAVISFDHYPLFRPDKDGQSARTTKSRKLYYEKLAVIRKHALERDIPFWNYFNAVPFGPHTEPTAAQLRWQIYSSISYGARGVLYFTYGTPRTFEFPRGGGLIDSTGRRTRNWYDAQRINARIKHLGPTLMQLTSTAVVRVEPGTETVEALKGMALRNITPLDEFGGDPANDYLVGMFTHEDGRRAVMLTNYRIAYRARPTVEFDISAERVTEVDQRTGKEVTVVDESPAIEGLQISLDAGEGRLFLLPR
ncbi:MAG: hypothetical protein QGH11_05410 [Pirellulaceae bacterium]|nr:hypothetical protein [Pirellulaceae bacterium]